MFALARRAQEVMFNLRSFLTKYTFHMHKVARARS